MIRIVDNKQVGKILSRRSARMDQAEKAVRPILQAVQKRGDAAIRDYTKKLDGSDRREVRVTEQELEAAWKRLSAEFRAAVKKATGNIRDFARLQVPGEGSVVASPGRRLSQIVRPLEVVAAYIPSGRYPLPSTLMMTVIPARVAGVKRIVACSPRPADAVWGTAAALRVNDFYQMGGAHAIAAFAYGTKTIPKADRIVGPGNIYVAAAKKLLAGEVGIDFVAGPTEILIIAAAGDPRWLAADLLAQAEHDVDASAVLLTTSRRLAEAVAGEIERQLDTLPTAAVAQKSIKNNGAIIVVRSLEEALDISNRFAPEHLSIPNGSLLDGVRHAGSVFIGAYSPEAAGDYASGPNHVLPTSGVARQRGGLSAADFVKIISVQELSVNALRDLAPAVTTLARAEGLEAHARSVEVRLG